MHADRRGWISPDANYLPHSAPGPPLCVPPKRPNKVPVREYLRIACEYYDHLDEQAFRFINRKMTDGERFSAAVSGILGKRITLDELTGRDQPEWRLCQPQA